MAGALSGMGGGTGDGGGPGPREGGVQVQGREERERKTNGEAFGKEGKSDEGQREGV